MAHTRSCMLQTSQQLVIIGVRADPKPIDRLPFAEPWRSIVQANPHRVHRLRRVHLSKAEARVVRIGLKAALRYPRLVLNRRGQCCEGLPKARGDA